MIRFLVNPGAGRGKVAAQLRRLQELAARAGAPLLLTQGAEDLTVQTRRAAAEGVERLVVAGGDGTLHHAIQGLAGTPCALGILPLGNGNDLAGALGIPGDLRQAVARALEGEIRRIDLGRLGQRVFACYAGVGLDSEVASFARERAPRWLRGSLLYVYSLLQVLRRFNPPEVTLHHEGGSFRGRVMLAVVANAPRFGGGMRIAPEARLDDGHLDLVMVREVSRLRLLAVFPRVYRGRHVDHPAVEMAQVTRVTLAVEPPGLASGDGEPLAPVGPSPSTVEIYPGALGVVV